MKQKWTFGTFTTEIQLNVHYSFMNCMGFFYTKRWNSTQNYANVSVFYLFLAPRQRVFLQIMLF